MRTKIFLLITGLLILSFLSSCHFMPSDEIYKVEFNVSVSVSVSESESEYNNYNFVFSDYKKNNYLDSLRNEFKIDSLVINANTDLQKALILLNWSNTRWKHSGSNTPEKSDAISVLKEAKTGQNFRCGEYSIVLSSALNSVGIPARVLGLKVKDVGNTLAGAGHVVTEAYLPELNKWIFLDGQMNFIPFLNNKPLNAVEFKDATINNKEQLELKSLNQKVNKEIVEGYINSIGKYLFHFDTKFDNREGEITERITYKGKTKLMLVPNGAENPETFQVFGSIDNMLYTHNLKDFYKEPKIIQ